MSNSLSVVVAATADHAQALFAALRGGGFDLRQAQADTPAGLSQELAEVHWDVLLAADDIPGLGLEAVLAMARPLRLPVLLMASAADPQRTRLALRAGVADVIWPAHLDRLPLAVERLLLAAAPGTSREAEVAGAMAVEQEVFVGNHAVQILVDPKNGQVVNANPLERDDRPLLYGIVNDVTDQRQRERELEAVSAFAAALRTAPTRATLVPVILEQLRKVTGAKGAALVLRQPGDGELVMELGVNWPQPAGTRSPPGTGLAGQVIATGQPQWGDLQPAAEAGEQPFAVGVPLVAQAQTLGALCVTSGRPPEAGQLRLLSAVGDMAANALNRSTLYEQTEQRMQRLAALHAIDIAITASFDLRVTLGIFLDHLVNQTRVDAAAVLLLNSSSQTLEYAAMRGLNTRPLRQAALRLSDSLPGRVVTQRQALHVTNLNEARPTGTRPYPAGQSTFTSYYGLPLIAKGKVQGVLEILHRGPLQADAEWVEFLGSLGAQAAIAIDNANLFTDLQRTNVELNLAYDATIEGWSRVLEARGIESSGHTRRVADLTVKVAHAAGLSQAELINIRRGALLHDIGMLSIPELVLLKAGPLSDAERAIVRQHPDYGFNILAPIVYLRPALDIPNCHHERWDGAGYPRGLRGSLIPLSARLFAVVDTWDALRADKPYRAAWTDEAALAYIQSNAGTQFDPAMVKVFMESGTGG